MIEIKIQIQGENAKTHTLQVPEKWSEMAPKQVESVASYLYGFIQNRKESQQIMLIDLLGLDGKDLTDVMDLLTDPEQEVSVLDLYPYLDWVTKEIAFDQDLYLVNYPYKRIGEGYANIELKQYFFIEHLYLTYRKERTERNLAMLLAAVYPKIEFDNEKIEADALQIQGWPTEKQKALLLNYYGQRNQFVMDYEIIFPKQKEKDDGTKEKQEEPNHFDTYLEILFELPNEKFGDVNQLAKTPITLVFNYFESIKKKTAKPV